MNKAFTRESDESGAEELPSFRPQLPPGTRNFITRDGADRLRQRLNDLPAKRQALATRNNEAGAAEEADQRKVEWAIRRLQQTLDSVIVAEIPADQEKIAFGATVTIRHGNREEESYRIVVRSHLHGSPLRHHRNCHPKGAPNQPAELVSVAGCRIHVDPAPQPNDAFLTVRARAASDPDNLRHE